MKETANKIQALIEKFKCDFPDEEKTIITVEFNQKGFGYLVKNKIVELKSFETNHFNGKIAKEKLIWTDHNLTQPFMRQGVFYAAAGNFDRLTLVALNEDYRLFRTNDQHKDLIVNLGFQLSNFTYNKVWDKIKFDVIVKDELVEDFIKEFRAIIGR